MNLLNLIPYYNWVEALSLLTQSRYLSNAPIIILDEFDQWHEGIQIKIAFCLNLFGSLRVDQEQTNFRDNFYKGM